ncbi:MAG: hypothetical protein J5518_00865 [Lachnospiraceae bacterium]|nr:hypothetical protein [Lachnospiraceae bacterium]
MKLSDDKNVRLDDAELEAVNGGVHVPAFAREGAGLKGAGLKGAMLRPDEKEGEDLLSFAKGNKILGDVIDKA